MNARAEVEVFANRSGAEGPSSQTCVWVEVLDAHGRSAATMQAFGLPLTLKRPRLQISSPAEGATCAECVQVVQVRPGVLAAIPASTDKVRFNGGPPTKLPHEFESWVLIDTQGTRFRVSNAGIGFGGAEGDGGDLHRRPYADAANAAKRLATLARRPLVLLVALMMALAAMALADWLSTTSQTTYWTVVTYQRGRCTDILVWWAAWCAISRALTGQLQWLAHARILIRAALTYSLAKLMLPPALAAAALVLPDVIYHCGWMALAAVAGWAHVSVLPISRQWRLTLRLAVLAGLGFGIASPSIAIFDSSHRVPALSSTLPVGLNFRRFEPVEQTLDSVRTLQPAADKARLVPYV